MNKQTYCPMPFMGASLQPNNVVLPCGQYMNTKPFQKIIPIQDVRSSDYMNELREGMLNGKHGDGCQCPAEEAKGLRSMRQNVLDMFGYEVSQDLKIVEIFFDNVCNLKCRSCCSAYSHLWYDDELEMLGETFANKKYQKNVVYTGIDTSKLEVVDIYGGEPMLSQDAENFFKMMRDTNSIQNITLALSTNGTTLPKENFEYALLNAKFLRLQVSIDAYGKLNDIMRSGSDFNELAKNLNYFNKLKDLRPPHTTKLMVHSAVSSYNINMLHELESFVTANYPNMSFDVQVVQFPLFLNSKHLPLEYKQRVKESMGNKFPQLVEYMMQDGENLFGHFINYHNKLNEMRGEDFTNLNPLLASYMEQYKDIPSWDETKQYLLSSMNTLKSM